MNLKIEENLKIDYNVGENKWLKCRIYTGIFLMPIVVGTIADSRQHLCR